MWAAGVAGVAVPIALWKIAGRGFHALVAGVAGLLSLGALALGDRRVGAHRCGCARCGSCARPASRGRGGAVRRRGDRLLGCGRVEGWMVARHYRGPCSGRGHRRNDPRSLVSREAPDAALGSAASQPRGIDRTSGRCGPRPHRWWTRFGFLDGRWLGIRGPFGFQPVVVDRSRAGTERTRVLGCDGSYRVVLPR